MYILYITYVHCVYPAAGHFLVMGQASMHFVDILPNIL